MAAGKLNQRASLAVRIEQEDGAGNTVSDWVEQFDCAAEFMHLRGGEAVIAARLENRHPMVVRIRNSAAARQVTGDWRLTDVRTQKAYAIRDVTPTTDRKWVEILVEGGVAV